ncbi:MAG: hypothetical protein VYC91_07795 [Acidobacteriota bacterium]|nr:hypothetical protein [Acidobacteriota bacterium]
MLCSQGGRRFGKEASVQSYLNSELFGFHSNRQSLDFNDGCWGTLGRNSIDGPGVATFDIGLRKDTQIGEDTMLEFRAEFFNLLNRANWRYTGANVFTSPTGVPSSASNKITTTSTTSRQIQFALKLSF